MKKLLIVGDSLSMSRSEFGICYEQMYSSSLAITYPGRLIVNASQRANSTKLITSNEYFVEYIIPMAPDVIILQIGVVDSLPRLLGDLEKEIVSLSSRFRFTRGITNLYIGYKSRRRFEITKKKPRVHVSIEDFESNLRYLKRNVAEECKFIVIDIAQPGEELRQKSYGADTFVRSYNEVLRKVFCDANTRFIDLYTASKQNDMILPDGYHISAKAHQYIFDQTKEILDSWEF